MHLLGTALAGSRNGDLTSLHKIDEGGSYLLRRFEEALVIPRIEKGITDVTRLKAVQEHAMLRIARMCSQWSPNDVPKVSTATKRVQSAE